MQEFDASQATIDRALTTLRREGLVSRRDGSRRLIVRDVIENVALRVRIIRPDWPSNVYDLICRSVAQLGHERDWLFEYSFYRTMEGLDMEHALGNGQAGVILTTNEAIPDHLTKAFAKRVGKTGRVVLADINVGILYLFAISSLGVYGILMAGWASNSRYAFLGALRSAAQMVSYEVSMGLVIITVLLCVGSLNLSAIVEAQRDLWFVIPLFPMAVVFFISTLAETNRHPFDLPEAEAELVAGYNVEYSGMAFALFFLGEYANMILMSGMTSILFLGGWLPPFDIEPLNWIPGPIWFAAKIAFCLFIFIWVRATFPRYRYDQLMRLGWKVFLPLSLFAVAVVAGVLLTFGWLPTPVAG